MNITKLVIAIFATLVTLPATAGSYTDALSTCVSDNTTGKERKELIKWVFISLAAHPEIRDISNTTAAIRDQASQATAKLVTRLLGETCANQAQSAVQNEGPEALETAFNSLGDIAMRELMSNKEVSASMSDFARYVDQKKLESIFSAK